MSGTCTAYSVPGGTTSLGWDAVYGVIAVNPNIIPYGTKMYITSPDGSVVYGYGVAGDTGGACMAGDIIADLCYNTIEECSQIGRRGNGHLHPLIKKQREGRPPFLFCCRRGHREGRRLFLWDVRKSVPRVFLFLALSQVFLRMGARPCNLRRFPV